MSSSEDRNNDADRKRQSRGKGRLVEIPPCADRKRREKFEADTKAWLRWYCGEGSGSPSPFWYEFTEQQREMIDAVDESIAKGHDKAVAASRGEGKTTICLRVALKNVLQGKARFPVIFGANGPGADDGMDAIKMELEGNDRLLADYPEVCVPIRALEGIAQRAHSQLVSGHSHADGKPFVEQQSHFVWRGTRKIIMPNVPGSPAAGAIIVTRGLDSAVRGLNIKGKRPDVAIIDDPDTEDTAENEKAATKLEKRIDRGVAGLGGQQRRIARVMITTLQSRTSVSYKYTDPKQKPSFRGRRNKFLIEKPHRIDLWDEYVAMKRADYVPETTKAHEFYLANRKAMDAGAVVANPNRFTPDEASSLEYYFSEVARTNQEAVDTELDNNPPEISAPIMSAITPHHIQKSLSGHKRKCVPRGCNLITHGIDVRKTHLHWVVRAWSADGSKYYTIDYGIQEVIGTKRGSNVGVEMAIYKAILQRWDDYREQFESPDGYHTEDGEIIDEQLTLVDAGWETQSVYAACLTIGAGIFPIMGCGKSAGCVKPNFTDLERETEDRKPGDGWFLTRQEVTSQIVKGRKKKSVWLVYADTDRWKRYEHERWMTDEGNPGRMLIFGEADPEANRLGRLGPDEKLHQNYAHQVCAEVVAEQIIKGKLTRVFVSKSDADHFNDGSYYSDVGGSMKGVRLLAPALNSIVKAKADAAAAATPANPKPPQRKPITRVFYDNEP
ncbi:terminase gpA endonuclease subunit [Anatilimnocola floriformis]|uniref:terminase gpA endonuclease subunit n=1 Tax=Anatilimnocola floriformis TaxID=2948575 RepID=UPI0020C5AEFE|nr:terminase gpA endonuclease subunit [Anatilimnocola floriformis]